MVFRGKRVFHRSLLINAVNVYKSIMPLGTDGG